MWDLFVDTAGSSILELSVRAIIGGVVVTFILLVLATVFKRNKAVQLYVFILLIAIIFSASALLFLTAIVHMQDTGVISLLGIVL